MQTWVYARYKTFQSKSHNNIKNKHTLDTAVQPLGYVQGYVQLGNANSTHTYQILNSGLLKTSCRSSEVSDAEAAYSTQMHTLVTDNVASDLPTWTSQCAVWPEVTEWQSKPNKDK